MFRPPPAKTNELLLSHVSKGEIFKRQLKNPLLLILFVTTVISYLMGSRLNAAVVLWMMFLSVGLGFWNEYRAGRTMEDLLKKISFMATIIRNGVKLSIPVRDIRLGDHVLLYPGAVVPADIKLIQEKGLEINESALSGESAPVRKGHEDKLCFMGTIVTSGEGQGVVTAIGVDTRFGQLSQTVTSARPETEFQKGLYSFGVLLVRVISLMTVFIFVINGLVGRPWLESAMFALTVAIGLTPELLPVVVTVSLAHGAGRLAKKDIIVKQLVAIEDLGNMEVLCCDKTGTLTEGKLQLASHLNPSGKEDPHVLQLALLCNSAIVHHKIFGDAIDTAVWQHALNQRFHLPQSITKVSEMPFDYEHRGMFTVIENGKKRIFIFKGAPDAVLNACTIGHNDPAGFHKQVEEWFRQGYRVIAVATKEVSSAERYTFGDAHDLKLEGFVLFSDPPKPGVRQALDHFEKLGVGLKIITGDNEFVTGKVCEQVDIPCRKILTGPDISSMTDQQLIDVVWSVDVFARMTPDKKLRVIRALRHGNHTVGYIGDGINDAPALHEADAGISVNTAVDVAKDTASIVLLKKSLNIIVEGIYEGRRTFVNTLKYILMGTSSNFGNMFSMAGASFLLPFLPMTPSQILLANALYDISQLSLPADTVDEEELLKPRKWDLGIIRKYMAFFGPISSFFDFLTFGMMYFLFRARDGLFQTGWFVESLITEIMVIFMIRTRRFPFTKSRPGPAVVTACIMAVLVGCVLPFSPLAGLFSMVPLPPLYFLFLILITIVYLGTVELGKKYFLHRALTPAS
jgi:Mg2+-importing ATPase